MYFIAIALSVTVGMGLRDVAADAQSPARIGGAHPHMLTPPPSIFAAMTPETSILLVGADDRGSRGRADTIIVAHINGRTKRATLLSIQRDTRVDIPGHGRDKINHAYRFGDVPLLKVTVEGLIDEKLHNYAKLDFETFEEVIDELGGVTIVVPDIEGGGRGMNYDDNADDLHIHLTAGEHRLNGRDAMHYVRYRKDSDLNRAERQRHFLKSLARQKLNVSSSTELADAARTLVREIDTDISSAKAVRLIGALAAIPPESIRTALLPVTPERDARTRVYYSEIDRAKARETRRELRRFLDGGGDAVLSVKECGVVVLNGTGEKGIAGAAAGRLREVGATVTATKNAQEFGHKVTQIRYHAVSKGAAQELKHILGTPDAIATQDDDFDAPGAASIIVTLGADFALE